jgi:NADPH:quinone reductase-like Zn-dependent oxidoreductase
VSVRSVSVRCVSVRSVSARCVSVRSVSARSMSVTGQSRNRHGRDFIDREEPPARLSGAADSWHVLIDDWEARRFTGEVEDCEMRALQFKAYGGPEVLEVGDEPEPHPGPGQIRIAVRAASVNPVDWKSFSGAFASGQPLVGTGHLGYDAAGVVDEIGEGVTGVSVGDEVLGLGRSTQAEYAVLDSWVAKPSSVEWAVAAAAGVAGETSERALRLLEVKTGDTLFVDGGAGGVGAVAVQMAVARDATVIASSSQANHDYLRELGATPVLYGEGVVARVRAAAGGPVDAVFDVAGKTPAEDLISLAPTSSQVVTIANFAAGQEGVRVTGGASDSQPVAALALVAELLAQNTLVVSVQTFPFDRAAEAYRVSQGGHVRGKLVLTP